MSSALLPCPHCHTQHPVAALPPAGTHLRCNACGNAFVTSAPPVSNQLQPMAGYNPYGQAPAPFGQAPTAYDPFAQMQLPGNALPQYGGSFNARPAASSGPDSDTWKIALGIGLGGVAVVFFAIVVSTLASAGRTPPSTPPIAAAPLPTTPLPATTSSPAPSVPVAANSSPTNSAATGSTATQMASRPMQPVPAMNLTPGANPLAPSGTGPQNQISQLKVVEAKSQFLYGWKRGEKYRYGFEAKNEGNAESSGGKVGVVEYELTDLPGTGESSDKDSGKAQASGTAFVVHSDGLLMTCNHVVAGSSALKVHLQGKVYPAVIVALDKPNDLALIRINATGLTALKLADSDRVRLAEDVKAIGYPLSDLLGRNVKITSGTIAGRIDDPEGPRLQVDITINPGNSGGPLVNSLGEVVGVNSAGLFGSRIQEVSFAVPSNLGRKLLETLRVDGNGKAASAPLSGPDLANKVTPGTAFVEVELGNEGAVLLQFTGSSKSTGNSILPPQQITSRMAASLAGDILGAQEDLPLGFGLSTFGTMILEKLPEDGQKKWEERRLTPLSVSGKAGGAQSVISLLLEEKIEYELKSVDNAQIVISKKTNVNTIGNSSLGTVKISGDGTWTFDRVAGVPQKLELKIDSHVSIAGKTNDFRGTTRYERLSSESPTPWQAGLEKELAAIDTSGPDDSGLPELPELPPLSLEPSSDAEVTATLRILKNKKKSPSELAAALETLSRMKPIAKRRDEVATTLHNLRTTMATDMLAWLLAARVWGTEKNVATVLYVLDAPTSNRNERIMALESLGRLPATKETAKAVIRYLSNAQLRNNALQALGPMNSAAEEPLAELLKHQDVQDRLIAVTLLARLGTKNSIPVLEKYLRGETDPRCRAVGTAALNLLRERVKVASAEIK